MRVLLVIAAVMTPGIASAQAEQGPRTPVAERTGGGETPQRIRSVTVRPGEQCPPSTGDEVVVCYRPDGSPYRIPSELREETPIPAQNQSWVNRAATVRDVSRVAGGLPNTCSPVGTGGQTGCTGVQGYYGERRERARQERAVPGGDD